MRNSKQRNLVLEIVNCSKSHPTAEDVYNECRKQISNISLGTVYRNLSQLVERGEIQRISNIDNVDHFDHNKTHNHFICEKCNQIIDIEEPYIPKYDYILNHQVRSQWMIFKGICKDCQK